MMVEILLALAEHITNFVDHKSCRDVAVARSAGASRSDVVDIVRRAQRLAEGPVVGAGQAIKGAP